MQIDLLQSAQQFAVNAVIMCDLKAHQSLIELSNGTGAEFHSSTAMATATTSAPISIPIANAVSSVYLMETHSDQFSKEKLMQQIKNKTQQPVVLVSSVLLNRELSSGDSIKDDSNLIPQINAPKKPTPQQQQQQPPSPPIPLPSSDTKDKNLNDVNNKICDNNKMHELLIENEALRTKLQTVISDRDRLLLEISQLRFQLDTGEIRHLQTYG